MPDAPFDSSQSPCCSRISFNPRKTMGLASGLASVSVRAPARVSARVLLSSFFSVSAVDIFACSAAVSMFRPRNCRHGIQTAADVRGKLICDGAPNGAGSVKTHFEESCAGRSLKSPARKGSICTVVTALKKTLAQKTILLEVCKLGAEIQ